MQKIILQIMKVMCFGVREIILWEEYAKRIAYVNCLNHLSESFIDCLFIEHNITLKGTMYINQGILYYADACKFFQWIF